VPDDPIAVKAYEQLAEAYDALIDTKPHNAYYERPATLSLLPEVAGKQVLDAGCGPGVYAEWLLSQGAQVVAFDVSPKMLRLAKRRLQDKARLLQADFAQPLDFLADASFDVVLSALALDYVKNWRMVFGEFHRLLRPAGHLVFSIQHPYAEFAQEKMGNYFEVELVEYEWTGFGTPVVVPCYRRSMQDLLNPLLGAGFQLERFLEPRPTEPFRSLDPEGFEQLSKRPGFLCLRAKKPRLAPDTP
jgi:ubiquinone/menaquinone biosynthesis C-methylase UbiE